MNIILTNYNGKSILVNWNHIVFFTDRVDFDYELGKDRVFTSVTMINGTVLTVKETVEEINNMIIIKDEGIQLNG